MTKELPSRYAGKQQNHAKVHHCTIVGRTFSEANQSMAASFTMAWKRQGRELDRAEPGDSIRKYIVTMQARACLAADGAPYEDDNDRCLLVSSRK